MSAKRQRLLGLQPILSTWAQAPVGGSCCPKERQRWAAATVARCAGEPRVLGYCMSGFGTGESEDQQRAMLASSLGELPQAALRMASGISTPHQARPGLPAHTPSASHGGRQYTPCVGGARRIGAPCLATPLRYRRFIAAALHTPSHVPSRGGCLAEDCYPLQAAHILPNVYWRCGRDACRSGA